MCTRSRRSFPFLLLLFFLVALIRGEEGETDERATEDRVRDFYGAFPYPGKDVTDFQDAEYSSPPFYPFMFPESINHYLYGGTKDFGAAPFNILIAGVGQGNDLLALALLFSNYSSVQITGIDINPSSLDILLQRIERYTNIFPLANIQSRVKVQELSVLDLDPDIHGLYDFVLASGVLHHMESPASGLHALRRVMRPGGGILLMVYGKIGRTHVYQMQDMLRILQRGGDSRGSTEADVHVELKRGLEMYKSLMPLLPVTNWFRRGGADYIFGSDGATVDGVLHVRDVAYTVPELFDWVRGAGLDIVEFATPERYKYKAVINTPELSTAGLNEEDRFAWNELFYGDISQHAFFASSLPRAVASASVRNLDCIMSFFMLQRDDVLAALRESGSESGSERLTVTLTNLTLVRNIGQIRFTIPSILTLKVPVEPIIREVLVRIDGLASTREIFAAARSALRVTLSDFEILAAFEPVYNQLMLVDYILLHRPAVNKEAMLNVLGSNRLT